MLLQMAHGASELPLNGEKTKKKGAGSQYEMFGTKTFSIKLYEYVEHFLYTYFLEF